jgi:hypothetical protein
MDIKLRNYKIEKYYNKLNSIKSSQKDDDIYKQKINFYLNGGAPSPNIEIYEYKLDGYTDASISDDYHMFNYPRNVKDKECGLIQTKIKNPSSVVDMDVRTCDVIASDTEISLNVKGDKNTIYNQNEYKKKYFDYIYTNCNPKTNPTDPIQLTPEYKEKCYPPTEFLKNYIISMREVTQQLQKIYKFAYKDDGSSFIYKLNITNTDKVICIGDIHGGFHTFYRLLLRFEILGYLNLLTYEITKGYKIIFTGDIVDRGGYSFEIISILYKLIQVNTNKNDVRIIYNRGNHEEESQYSLDGFMIEFTKKFNNICDDLDITLEQFKILQRTFFNMCPVATILNCDDIKQYFIAHGGFSVKNPYEIDDNNKLVNSESDIYQFNSDNICIVDNNTKEQIMWNDFISTKNYDNISGRGIGIKISQKEIDLFLKNNKINFIIRGHQDNYHNSFLFDRTVDKPYPPYYGIRKNRNEFRIKQLLKNPEIVQTAMQGPIAVLDINSFDTIPNHNFMKVITISTNTAYGRPFTYDSFIILKQE